MAEMPPPLLDIDGLAALLCVPRSWVRDAVTARTIPITWIGRHARFSADDVAEIIAAGRERPATAAPIAPVRRVA